MNGLMGLDAYQVALQLAEEVYTLEITGNLRDQLTRASESVVLNIAEAHPTTGKDRARRFRLAANEASECRAALTLLKIRQRITPETFARMWNLADRVCAMLWKLSRPG